MNTQEIGAFLGFVALHDNRKVGPGDIMAWEDVLPAEISLEDARAALRAHRRAGSEWLMPSHIINAVGSIRRERLTRAGTPPMPGDLTHKQEKAWRELWCAAVKDGADSATAARIASEAMQLPLELEASPAAMQAERERLIAEFAQRPRTPKPKPEPKPRIRWGPWALGYHDDNDYPVFTADGAVALFHDGGPYGIPLGEFHDLDALRFWVDHIGGKPWGTGYVVGSMVEAFWALNPDIERPVVEPETADADVTA